MNARGLLGNKEAYARQLLRSGVPTRVNRYLYNQVLDQSRAASAVNSALQNSGVNPAAAKMQRYIQIASARLDGLGDDTDNGLTISDDAYPVTYDGSADDNSSWWSDVAKSFVGQIGAGIGRKISGAPATPIVAAPKPGLSTGTMLAVGALVGLPLIYLIARKA